MAGEAVVGALRVVLGMDTAQFEDGAKKAATSLDNFGKKLGIAAAVTAFAAAAVSFGTAIKGVIDEADKLGKAAQKFGVPVEQLSALKFAADLSDVSLEALGKSLVILSKNMQTVAGGATNIAAAAFSNLGISVKNADGTLKSANDVFLDVADRFKDMQDGATKTALAVAIFGRAGAELIPLLNQGRDGIKSLTDEARRMGIVITDDVAKAAENFNDNLKRLGKVQEAIIIQILGSGGLLGSLEQLSFRMVEGAQNAERWKTVSDGLATTLQALSTWVLVVAHAIDTLTLPIQAIVLAFARIAKGDFAGAWEAITSTLGRAIPNLRAILDLITEGQEDVSQFVEMINIANASLALLAQIKFVPKPFSEEQFKLGEKFTDTLAKLKLQARELKGEFIGLGPGFVAAAQQFEKLDGFGKSFGTTLDSLTPKQRQLALALMEVAGARLTEEFLTPWQLYEQQLARINVLLANQKISAEIAAQASIKAALDMAASYATAATGIVSNMSNAFRDLASINKKYAGAAKALAIAEGLAQTFLGAIKAYTGTVGILGPVGAAVAAAAATAAGLANVAKISATQFAQGGSFKVGGAGGIDSQMITMALTPGEMVDVRRPGNDRTTVSEVTVNMRGRDIFTGDAIRDLFAAINQGTSDGYRLKIA